MVCSGFSICVRIFRHRKLKSLSQLVPTRIRCIWPTRSGNLPHLQHFCPQETPTENRSAPVRIQIPFAYLEQYSAAGRKVRTPPRRGSSPKGSLLTPTRTSARHAKRFLIPDMQPTAVSFRTAGWTLSLGPTLTTMQTIFGDKWRTSVLCGNVGSAPRKRGGDLS